MAVKHLVFLLAVAQWGCKNTYGQARAVDPPTAEEAEAFGKEIAAKLAPCDAAALDRMFDADLFLARIVAGRPIRDSDGALDGLGRPLCAMVPDPAVRVTYLHTVERAGTPRPLLRLLDHGDELNYYELELDKHGGRTRAVDLYILLMGQRFSDTCRKFIDGTEAANIRMLEEVETHIREARWQQAYDRLRALPADLRTNKVVRRLEIQAASALGGEPYRESLDDYAATFPNDPSIALIAMDQAMKSEHYASALAAIDELDKHLGGDPYLETRRADAWHSAGRLDEAIAAAKRATAREPTMRGAWWSLLTQQAAAKRYPDAIATLEVLRDKLHADVSRETLAADERFTAFAESPEFLQWTDAANN